jgi:CheY-like chemotaxis protein
MNLVVNAREAMNGAGRIVVETANATVRAEDCGGRSGCVPGEYVSLRVRDSGCGMDGESLAHIFEPFFTTKEGDRGTGLGLSTLYGIVKQNQGYIDVQSVPGAGTTFTIYLRRHAGPAEAVREAREEKVPPAPGQTVLVVEDEGALLELSRTLLSKAGYRILSASSPAEALRIAAEHPGPIHLLLTDVVMPGMSGSELTRRLKAQRPELTYLFTSGYPVADVVFPFELANEDRQRHFLEKPYTLQGLTDAILRLLDPGQADA